MRLELECCGIGDAGAITLAAAVASNPYFRRLDLALNVAIGRAGRAKLAAAADGRPGIWHKKTAEDTPWRGSGCSSDDDEDDEDDDEYDDDDVYESEDDGYFATHRPGRSSPWLLLPAE